MTKFMKLRSWDYMLIALWLTAAAVIGYHLYTTGIHWDRLDLQSLGLMLAAWYAVYAVDRLLRLLGRIAEALETGNRLKSMPRF